MKKQLACKILRKYGFVPKHQTNKIISWKKNLMCPNSTWKAFMNHIFMLFYLTEDLPEEGIFIKELNVKLGGTLTVDLRGIKNERERTQMSNM